MNALPSRRAALGALASASALALPVGAMSAATPAASSPDVALLKLLDEVRAAHEHSDALLIALNKFGDENPSPPWPPALVRTEDDVSRFRFDGEDRYFVGDPYEPGPWMREQEALLKILPALAPLPAADNVAAPEADSVFPELVSHYRAQNARFLEIKAAMAQWDADCEQARERSGYAALEDEHCAASAKLWDLVRLAARTPAGVLAKVAMAAALFGKDYFDITAEGFAAKKEVSAEDFLLSAARDVAPAVSSGVLNF